MTGRWRVEKRQTIWALWPTAWFVVTPSGMAVDFFDTHAKAIAYAHWRARSDWLAKWNAHLEEFTHQRQEQS